MHAPWFKNLTANGREITYCSTPASAHQGKHAYELDVVLDTALIRVRSIRGLTGPWPATPSSSAVGFFFSFVFFVSLW
jgi:hypothetical protein